MNRPPLWTIAAAALLMLAFSGGVPAVDITRLPDARLQERYEALTHELRCMKCQNNSIADSPADLAADLRRDVSEQLIAGKSDDEIRAWMVDRYGAVILFTPPMNASSAWLWLLPVLAVFSGIFIAVRVVRGRSRLVESDASSVAAEDDAR